MLKSKSTREEVDKLIWVYLGNSHQTAQYPNVAFLSGRGVCNGHALDLLIHVKKLKSINNKGDEIYDMDTQEVIQEKKPKA